MRIIHRFNGDDKVSELVRCDYNILPVLSRLGLPLGFGSQTISQVCAGAQVDLDMFLLIVNFTLSGKIDRDMMARVPASEVAGFLLRSHVYFLDYKFPHIRRNLLNALDEDNSNINPAIIRYFDTYMGEVRKHFAYEEEVVFPYIRALEQGSDTAGYCIAEFLRQHDEIGDSLNELKNIIMRYYRTSRPDVMYDVLVDLYTTEDDLAKHTDIENHILVPMVERIEKR